MSQWKPTDKYTRLKDDAWRNSPGALYNLISGVRQEEMSAGGPMFGDGIGYVLCNVLGDYYQGVGQGTVGHSTGLGASTVIGAGTITVISGTGFATGGLVSIGGTATTACEVRTITNVTSGTVITLNAPLYQAHSSSASSGTVIQWSGYNNILHNFALLNNGLGAGGSTASQPPTYTWYDFSGVPASSGARYYGFGRFSELSFTSAADKLVMWDGKVEALASQIAASTPTVSLSSVAPQAAWLSTVTIGGAGTLNTMEWKCTLSRKQEVYFENAGQQDFFALPVGPLTNTFSFNFGPASDELEFIDYLNNSQPTLQLVAANGLSGTLSSSLTITAQQIGFLTGELNDSKTAFGFDETGEFIANTTNVGPSLGFGPAVYTLANSVVNY